MDVRNRDFPHLLEVLKIIEGAVGGDTPKVVAYTEQLANKLAGDGQERAALRLRKAIKQERGVELHPC